MGKNVEAGAEIIAKIKDGVGGSGRGQISILKNWRIEISSPTSFHTFENFYCILSLILYKFYILYKKVPGLG